MDPDLKYPWQQAVLEAFTAPRDSLLVKINTAEKAISARPTRQNPPDNEERVALNDALRALRVLIREAEVRTKPPRPKNDEGVA